MINLAALVALTATPLTIDDRIADAKSGDSITLVAGRYARVAIVRRTFAKPLQINAAAATIGRIMIQEVDGVVWSGGSIIAPRAETFGITVASSTNVTIRNARVKGPKVGLSISMSSGVNVLYNMFDGVRSDGINIAMSQRINIIGNACLNTHPIRPIYASDGTLLIDGDHPDCIQGWSRRGRIPTSDILIQDNAADGEMQGISFFDPGQGGFDRITIRNNIMNLRYWHGITVLQARRSLIQGNVVRTVPRARALNWPFQLIRTWILVTGKGNRVCGNIVGSYPSDQSTQRC